MASESTAPAQAKLTQERARGEAWKFYAVLVLWPAYMLLIPYAYMLWGAFAIPLMLFPGVFLFTWVGYLMHECWHKYVPGLPNDILYNIFSYMLITDPQLYRLVHGFHHSQVNSYDDVEFHPMGEIRSRSLRALHNVLEIFLGVLFIVVLTLTIIPRHPRHGKKYRFWKTAVSVLMWTLFLGGIGYLSHLAFGASAVQVVMSYVITILLGSFVLHHSQLVEHGNLISRGNWNQRNLKTRNLSRSGITERLFLSLTHNDSHEHVLHHTMVSAYTRPFAGQFPMPENAVWITFRDYGGILWDMMTGRDSQV